jgi:transaldolase
MRKSPVATLLDFGQSPWLDFLERGFVRSGRLSRLVERCGLRGVRSNLAIFARALEGPGGYDAAIRELSRREASALEIHEALVLEDASETADLLGPVYADSRGDDGFVSVDVSPRLAHDTEGTVSEARRLWALLNRDNVLIQVPATSAGIPAITQLVSEGINVDVTLLFSIDRYREVAAAYLTGMSRALARGRPLEGIASVASFFLGRIDAMVDARLQAIAEQGGSRGREAASLRGQAAIASAKQAYACFEQIFGTGDFRRLASRGARVQRLLWASTGTRDPASSDVKYVEPLIGPQTVSTMSPATLEAYDDHGRPGPRLTEGLDRAARLLQALENVGVSLQRVGADLESEGIGRLLQRCEALLETIERRRLRSATDGTPPAG